MKCFVLSLHRSGTKSVSALLQQLGLSTIHWPGRLNDRLLQPEIRGYETDPDRVLDVILPKIINYDAASDVPIPTLYPVLYNRFPEAKFILLKRDPAEWVKSVRKSVGSRPFRPFERVQYWTYFPGRPRYITTLSDAELETMYLRHTGSVIAFFSQRDRDRLGVFDLLDPTCGAKISDFLGFSRQIELPRASEERRERDEAPVAKLGMFRRLLSLRRH